jgi:hypothetical protein
MSEPRLQEVYFDVPLKKAVDALAIVPTKDKITVLARKVYNVMMHETQKQGVEPEIYRMRLQFQQYRNPERTSAANGNDSG